MAEVRLYEPEQIVGSRTESENLAAAVKGIEKVLTTHFEDEEASPKSRALLLALCLPGGTAHYWFDDGGAEFSEATIASFQKKLTKLEAPKVWLGPVAFGVYADINGGVGPGDPDEFIFPKQVEALLREGKKAEGRQAAAPDGFRVQILEPTGGSILCPKDWHYAEAHNDQSFSWILSREEPKDGYETGVRIQVFIDVEDKTGATAEEYLKNYLKKKSETAEKVHGWREEVDQGLVSRLGLETEENKYRILSSGFWGNRTDLMAITTAGTPEEQWEEFAPVFDQMSTFELIDMKRFLGEEDGEDDDCD